MSTRRMLIISNPGEKEDENYCEGVNKDVMAYGNFFTSVAGGAWRDEEIYTLKQPSPLQVDSALSDLQRADYSMVIFCGHGYSHLDGTTMIELKKGCDYDATNLNRGAPRHSVILDSCRVVWDILLEMAMDSSEYRAFSKRISLPLSRSRFDMALSQCPTGLVVLYACDSTESAEDDSRSGGYYSHALLTTSINWSETSSHEKTASIVAMHNAATGRVQSITSGRQNPQITKPRSGPYFPFAVSVHP